MELILNNPYRVLGADATISRKDLVKRISDLEMFAELGKEKNYPLDLSNIVAFNRTLESIKEAERS